MKNFSGGMSRRLNLVAALLHRPKLLLCDEPTVGIDPQSRNAIFEYLERLNHEGLTIIYSTHYMEEAQALCDHVAFMNAGQMVAVDTPQGLIRRLNAPYRITLTTALPLDDAGVRAIPGALEVMQERTADGCVVRVRAQSAPAVTTALTNLATQGGVEVIDLAVQPGTLEDVFLAVTGRGLNG